MKLSLSKKYIGTFIYASQSLGIIAATCIFAMMCIQVTTIIYRYLMTTGSIALQESALYAHATAFMVAIGCTLHHDKHVRVDIFYRKMSKAQQKWVNTFGFFFCLLPLCLTLLYVSIPFIEMAWSIQEQSPEPGGLSYLYLLKTLLIAMPITTLISGIGQLALEWIDD